MKYLVLDKYNQIVRAFYSYGEAHNFIVSMNRFDWKIVQ